MINKIKKLVVSVFALTMIFMAINTDYAYANVTEKVLIAEGYLPDGSKYETYEIITTESDGISPRIVVSHEVETYVTFTGHITPPNSFRFDDYVAKYNIKMTGSLKLISVYKDYDLLLRKETRTIYKGTVFGNI